jgi:DNA-binding MarR family transcriptional regulator
MSSDAQEIRAETLGALARKLRQFHGLGASFYRAAAARSGMTITDLEVVDLLENTGPMTAGQLAELTGLTTGAITGMLNRLEEAGLVRRERDPNDARRVLVRLAPEKDKLHEIDALFASLEQEWADLASRYNDEQIAFLLEFLQGSSAISRQELARLREAPQGDEGISSTPLGDIRSARLVVPAGIFGLTVRAGSEMPDLYQARFEGSVPDVKTKDGVVTIRYPKRLWLLGGGQGAAEIILNATIPWWIAIQGGVSTITAELGRLNLAGLEVKGGMSMIRLELPVPADVVPIRVSGSASDITIRRPAGVPARVHLKGWVSTFVFDEQTFGNVGNDVRLRSPGYDGTDPGYDIEVASSASMVTITAD